jgi:hypothetical protein
MSDDAIPQLPAPSPRRRPISKKVRDACEAIVEGNAKTIAAAARRVGISREHLSKQLHRPHVAEYLRQRAAKSIALGVGRASARLMKLVDASSEHVAFDASKHVLGIAGIKPATEGGVSINLGLSIRAGYVIDLSEPDDGPKAKVVDVACAKPAIEQD